MGAIAVLENARHEKFAQCLFSGMSQRKAYLEAFPNARRCKDETIDNKASKLYNTDEVRARLNELKIDSANKAILSVVDRKIVLSDIATDADAKTSDRINAIDKLNKMEGIYEKVVNVKGELHSPFANLSTEELRKLIDNSE